MNIEFDREDRFDAVSGLTLVATHGERRILCLAGRRKLEELAQPFFREGKPCPVRRLRPHLEREFARLIAASPRARTVRL